MKSGRVISLAFWDPTSPANCMNKLSEVYEEVGPACFVQSAEKASEESFKDKFTDDSKSRTSTNNNCRLMHPHHHESATPRGDFWRAGSAAKTGAGPLGCFPGGSETCRASGQGVESCRVELFVGTAYREQSAAGT